PQLTPRSARAVEVWPGVQCAPESPEVSATPLSPTATQVDASGHETPKRSSAVPVGAGAQPPALRKSTVPASPTATQLSAPGQVTPLRSLACAPGDCHAMSEASAGRGPTLWCPGVASPGIAGSAAGRGAL